MTRALLVGLTCLGAVACGPTTPEALRAAPDRYQELPVAADYRDVYRAALAGARKCLGGYYFEVIGDLYPDQERGTITWQLLGLSPHVFATAEIGKRDTDALVKVYIFGRSPDVKFEKWVYGSTEC